VRSFETHAPAVEDVYLTYLRERRDAG